VLGVSLDWPAGRSNVINVVEIPELELKPPALRSVKKKPARKNPASK
jgi:hypothetical protein